MRRPFCLRMSDRLFKNGTEFFIKADACVKGMNDRLNKRFRYVWMQRFAQRRYNGDVIVHRAKLALNFFSQIRCIYNAYYNFIYCVWALKAIDVMHLLEGRYAIDGSY